MNKISSIFVFLSVYRSTTIKNLLSFSEKGGACDNELCYRCGKIERCKTERNEKCF